MVALHAPTPELVNRVQDPSMESGVGGAQSSASVPEHPITYDTGVFHSGVRSVRTDRTTTTPSDIVGIVNMLAVAFASVVKVAVTPGEIISAGAMMRCGITGSRARISMPFRDSSNAGVGTTPAATLRAFPTPGAWEWFVLENVTVPANASHVLMQATVRLPTGGTTVGGEQAWYDSAAVFSGPKTWDYFDGNSPSASWNGTVNRSPSTRLSLPWQRWDGTKLVSLVQEGVWDGSAVQPQTFTDVSVA